MKYEWLVPYVSIFQNVTKETFQEESFQKAITVFLFWIVNIIFRIWLIQKNDFEMLRDRDVASFERC